MGGNRGGDGSGEYVCESLALFFFIQEDGYECMHNALTNSLSGFKGNKILKMDGTTTQVN